MLGPQLAVPLGHIKNVGRERELAVSHRIAPLARIQRRKLIGRDRRSAEISDQVGYLEVGADPERQAVLVGDDAPAG